MLVLSRKIGESIKIGNDITITILDINRGQVRIGIDAPKSVNIVRNELLDRHTEIDSNTAALDLAANRLQPRIGMRKPQQNFEVSPR